MSGSHGIRFEETGFWVRHRRRDYGPFDYEWSKDLRGIELLYQGRKFGECCSEDEIFADLKEFGLPMCVVEVGSIVLGCVVYGVVNGLSQGEREALLADQLRALGYGRFVEGGE